MRPSAVVQCSHHDCDAVLSSFLVRGDTAKDLLTGHLQIAKFRTTSFQSGAGASVIETEAIKEYGPLLARDRMGCHRYVLPSFATKCIQVSQPTMLRETHGGTEWEGPALPLSPQYAGQGGSTAVTVCACPRKCSCK